MEFKRIMQAIEEKLQEQETTISLLKYEIDGLKTKIAELTRTNEHLNEQLDFALAENDRLEGMQQ